MSWIYFFSSIWMGATLSVPSQGRITSCILRSGLTFQLSFVCACRSRLFTSCFRLRIRIDFYCFWRLISVQVFHCGTKSLDFQVATFGASRHVCSLHGWVKSGVSNTNGEFFAVVFMSLIREFTIHWGFCEFWKCAWKEPEWKKAKFEKKPQISQKDFLR